MEKQTLQAIVLLEEDSSKDVAAEDVGPQIPEMFKQPLRTKCVTPQIPGNEVVQNARTSTHNGNIHDSKISTAGAAHNQEGTGMTLLLGDHWISELDSQQGSRPAVSSQIVVGERADLGSAANEAGFSYLSQQDALHEVTIGGRKAPLVAKTDVPTISRRGMMTNCRASRETQGCSLRE
ncbi:hypothetical protein NDU88_005289 [Pleurodeles waltl]|uniref:Uncharacterized protein n=1 Tax=Pleurodeles waltl TaxID=8319 RepID=A0AAV7LP50_PLEWA|nr:hypothetical protein NDU88_005289 [Pleurodeles waltl]